MKRIEKIREMMVTQNEEIINTLIIRNEFYTTNGEDYNIFHDPISYKHSFYASPRLSGA